MSIVYYCSKCGNQLANNVKFCSNCGQEVVMKGQTPQAKTETDGRSSSIGVALGAFLIIIVVIIALLSIYMLVQSVEELESGHLHIEVKNRSDTTISFSYYIDGDCRGTESLNPHSSVTFHHNVEEGTHTIRVAASGVSSYFPQTETIYIPKHEHGYVSFSFD